MQQGRVRSVRFVSLAVCFFISTWCNAQFDPGVASGQRALAQISGHSPRQELESLFARFEQLLQLEEAPSQPVVMVLHGPEVSMFLRSNYRANKGVVDKAAKLSALGVVDIRVCESRIDQLGGHPDKLVPFVHSVPDGLDEIDRLVAAEQYVSF